MQCSEQSLSYASCSPTTTTHHYYHYHHFTNTAVLTTYVSTYHFPSILIQLSVCLVLLFMLLRVIFILTILHCYVTVLSLVLLATTPSVIVSLIVDVLMMMGICIRISCCCLLILFNTLILPLSF